MKDLNKRVTATSTNDDGDLMRMATSEAAALLLVLLVIRTYHRDILYVLVNSSTPGNNIAQKAQPGFS
jgi:hypothetical protein